MNPVKLQDALNLLEDDLIAPVEAIRRNRIRWQHIAALAACLAVVCVMSLFGMKELSRGNTEAAPGPAEETLMLEMETDKSGRGDDADLNIPGKDMVDEAGEVVIMDTVLVEVLALADDHFLAKVLTADRNYATGTQVKVILSEHTRFIRGKDVSQVLSAEAFFSEGAVLNVDYAFTREENTIHAQCISFGE